MADFVDDDESPCEKSEREEGMIKAFNMKKKMEEDMQKENDNEKIRRGRAKLKEQKRRVTPQGREIEALIFSLVGPDTKGQKKLASLVAEDFVRIRFMWAISLFNHFSIVTKHFMCP